MMDPFPAPSELIAARVPIPPSAPAPASTHAVPCPTGCPVPAPGSLPPRLFLLFQTHPSTAAPSAAIPTPSVKPSSFHHDPISPSAPSFSPIGLPLPRLTPLPNSLRLPCPGKPHPLSLLMLLRASPHGFSLGHRGPSPGHCPSRTVPSRDEKCPSHGCHSSQPWGSPTSSRCPEGKKNMRREMQPLRSGRARTS